ncbi:MAG: universal stress protein UspA [Candidatus Faecivicinus sp.]
MKEKNVLVCVTGQLSCERLIVAGARIAEHTQGQVYVLHVARTGKNVLGYANEPEALEYLLGVSVKHGADMVVVHSDDVLGTIEAQARERRVGTLVSGRAANYSGWDLLDELKTRIPDVEFEIM